MSLKVKVVFAAAVALLAAAVSAQVVNGDFSKVGAGGRPEVAGAVIMPTLPSV